MLIAIAGPDKLQILVDPRLREIVAGSDLSYIEHLFEDMLGRMEHDRERMFVQLCALSVGRLVCSPLGTTAETVPALLDVLSTFRPLAGTR